MTRTEYEVWRDEITAPRLTVAQRVAKWFDRPGQEPTPAPEDTTPEMYRWWSLDELTEGRA